MTEPHEALPEELARRAAAAGSMDALKASGAFDERMAESDAVPSSSTAGASPASSSLVAPAPAPAPRPPTQPRA